MSLPYVCNFMVVYMLLGLTMRIRVVQQYQMNRYFHFRFLILYDLLYCAQFIPNIYRSRSYIVIYSYVQKGLRQGASLWQLLFVLEFNQKASYLYSILENALDSNETKTQSKTVHPAKEGCLFKACNNYSAKEPIQVSSDTSLFYYDFMMIVQ